MSTNYYTYSPVQKQVIHIGQSSAGWSFLLHSIPDLSLTEWPEWEVFLKNGGAGLWDEYGGEVMLSGLKRIVCDRPPWEGTRGRNLDETYIMGGLLYRKPCPFMSDLRNGEHGTYQITEEEFS